MKVSHQRQSVDVVCKLVAYTTLFVSLFNLNSNCQLMLYVLLLPPPKKEVMFLVRSVCLSVRRITRKLVNGF